MSTRIKRCQESTGALREPLTLSGREVSEGEYLDAMKVQLRLKFPVGMYPMLKTGSRHPQQGDAWANMETQSMVHNAISAVKPYGDKLAGMHFTNIIPFDANTNIVS